MYYGSQVNQYSQFEVLPGALIDMLVLARTSCVKPLAPAPLAAQAFMSTGTSRLARTVRRYFLDNDSTLPGCWLLLGVFFSKQCSDVTAVPARTPAMPPPSLLEGLPNMPLF